MTHATRSIARPSVFAAVLLGSNLAACGASHATCIENASVTCACTDGRSGAQLCSAGRFEACTCTGASPDAAPATDAAAVDAAPSGACIPFVVGAFQRVFVPDNDRYLNDHTVIQGPEGLWHVYGIAHPGLADPPAEVNFLHATAPSLEGPWSETSDILTADPSVNEQVLWAPYAFQLSSSDYAMYYWGGGASTDVPPNGIRRADSADLTTWVRQEHPNMPNPAVRPPGGRDPMMLQVNGEWWLYSVGVDAMSRGQIVVSRSTDLRTWSAPFAVITDPVPSWNWGNLESPFVVQTCGAYYLFLTRTGAAMSDYVRTVVFRSTDPGAFTFDAITEIGAHASEIVVKGPDMYITSAGWTSEVGEDNRGLLIARLAWTSPSAPATMDSGVDAGAGLDASNSADFDAGDGG